MLKNGTINNNIKNVKNSYQTDIQRLWEAGLIITNMHPSPTPTPIGSWSFSNQGKSIMPLI